MKNGRRAFRPGSSARNVGVGRSQKVRAFSCSPTDKHLGPKEDGIEAIPSLLELRPHVQIVVCTASRDPQDAARAVNLGAFWFVTKEMSDGLVAAQIDRALSVGELALENVRARRQASPSTSELTGRSVAMRLLRSRLRAVAETTRPVLLHGETGTGKSTAARIIHDHRCSVSGNAAAPFFSVNMGAISSELAERELFGNERGAFTDAKDARPGFFELANGGTLFLDEIGEAPLDLQVKLLKVIEEGRFVRIGGSSVRQVSFKLVCASNANLEERVLDGTFREDLYFRISTFPIKIPALSERREDVPDIIEALLPRCCRDNNVQISLSDLPPEFVESLAGSPLRGNIREVEQQLSRLLVYAPKDRNGRPQLERWRDVLGPIRKNAQLRTKTSLRLQDFETLPFDVVGPGFPGLDEFLALVTDKVLQDATAKYQTLRELSTVLKASIGRLSAARRRAGASAREAN